MLLSTITRYNKNKMYFNALIDVISAQTILLAQLMKNRKTLSRIPKKVCFLLLFSLVSLNSFAQDEISGLFKSSKEDAEKLIGAYLSPFFRGFGHSLNAGWNTSGATKKFGRFELRVGVSGSLIPEADKVFDVSKLGLSSRIGPANLNNVLSPTVGGEETDGPLMNLYDDNQNLVGQFTLPKGANLPFVPAPQLQATLGFLKGMDFTFRLVPKIKIGEEMGTLGMTGAGVKVNITRLLAGKTADKVLPFDLAAALGYTQLNYELPLDVQKPGSNYDDQLLKAKFSGVNMEAIISKKLLFFTAFGSLAYQSSESNVDLKGTYPFQINSSTYVDFVDPISINQKNGRGLRTSLGMQFNLAFLRVWGAYTFGGYQTFNTGIGLGIGK
jgi:hypothetical protein